VQVPARVRIVLALAAALPALAGCESSSRIVAASIREGVADTTFSMRVGQEARVGGSIMRFSFVSVTSDSRCPSDVVCVWAGNAAVQIGVSFGMGPTVLYVLNTGLDPRFVDLGSFRITLVDLQPYPVSTSRIPSDRYVATFRFQRIGFAPD
jgi:hypothetical protein